MILPKIRENLLVQDLNDEVLIYDQITNKSYCLNSTARTVFNACDGKKTFSDVSLPDEMIYLTLDELRKQNLIQGDYTSHFTGMNRREIIKKVGLSSMIALPVISSLIAPTAAVAASTCAPTSACFSLGQDICINCIGPTSYTAYAVGSGCTGAIIGSGSLQCNGPTPVINGNAVYRRG